MIRMYKGLIASNIMSELVQCMDHSQEFFLGYIIGAGRILWTCANGKRALFRDDLQKVSSGNMEYILRGT